MRRIYRQMQRQGVSLQSEQLPPLEEKETPTVGRSTDMLEKGEDHECSGGHSSNVATVLVLLKAFVGGTLLVLPSAIARPGLLAGNLTLWSVGLLELWCMLKLLEAHRINGGSYGQLAGLALGPLGSHLVEASIVISQLGFVSAEMIYVARNGAFVVEWLSKRALAEGLWLPWLGGIDWTVALLWLQLIFAIPVAFYRNLGALTIFNLIGNVLTLVAVGVMAAVTIVGLSGGSWAGTPVGEDCSMRQVLVFMGFSVFAFEGINMVIPMYDAHKDKSSFTPILVGTIFGVIMLFSVFSSANVLLYGEALQPILTMNLPSSSLLVFVVPLLFAVASLVLVVLMAFPTYEILEGAMQRWFQGPSGPCAGSINAFRACLMVLCAFVAQFGGHHLDLFLSLVGAIGCVPLAFVYPAIVHLRLVARGAWEVLGDVAVLILGSGVVVFCTCSALEPLLAG